MVGEERINIIEWALQIAEVTASRSEDPYKKVGAVAVSHENRVIATAYNGLAPGVNAPPKFWEDRDKRLPYMIHAEQNLCSLIKRGHASFVAMTLSPCGDCLKLLCAHGIQRIYFREFYQRDQSAMKIAEFYQLTYCHVPKRKIESSN